MQCILMRYSAPEPGLPQYILPSNEPVPLATHSDVAGTNHVTSRFHVAPDTSWPSSEPDPMELDTDVHMASHTDGAQEVYKHVAVQTDALIPLNKNATCPQLPCGPVSGPSYLPLTPHRVQAVQVNSEGQTRVGMLVEASWDSPRTSPTPCASPTSSPDPSGELEESARRPYQRQFSFGPMADAHPEVSRCERLLPTPLDECRTPSNRPIGRVRDRYPFVIEVPPPPTGDRELNQSQGSMESDSQETGVSSQRPIGGSSNFVSVFLQELQCTD